MGYLSVVYKGDGAFLFRTALNCFKRQAFKILNDLEADELRAIWSHDNISSASKVSLTYRLR